MLASMTLLNRVGQTLAQDQDVHAMTDVTGFGLLGHSLEVARGSGVSLDIDYQRIPFLAQAAGSRRGWICNWRIGAQLGELR